MRSPNLNSLRMFDAAARHLNFRAAAEELNLTQGAVAQQVRRLEADLGHALFHRRARGLEFTETGRRYHSPVRRALDLIDKATRELRPEISRITLSLPPSFASKWFVPRLRAFADAHPDISIRTVASEGLADFKSDGVDIAIRYGHPPFGPGLKSELLVPLDLRAVCSPDLSAKAGPIRGLSDLTNLTLIQDGHAHWDALLGEAGLTAAGPRLQFNQTALAMDAAANGQGVALAPRPFLDADLAQGRLVEIWQTGLGGRTGYYMVYPEIRRPAPARQLVIDWLLAECAEAESGAD